MNYSKTDYPIQLGSLSEDIREFVGHILAMGVTRSGKSNVLYLLRKSICDLMSHYRKKLIYICVDSKKDAIRYFDNNLPKDIPLYFICPTDKYGDILHFGKEVNKVIHVKAIIDALMPDNPKSHDPFWSKGAKSILTGVIVSLISLVGSNYNFDTVAQVIFSDFDYLIRVLGKNDSNIPLLQSLIGNSSERTRDSMFINLFVELEPLIFLASTFQRANRFVTLKQILSQRKAVLVLGTDQGNLSMTAPMNRLVLARLFQHFSSMGTDYDGNKILVEIDEFQKQGKINGIVDTLQFTTGMGISFILATQTLEGLHHYYADQEINSLLSNCTHRMLLKMGSYYSANFFSQAIGNIPPRYEFRESIDIEGKIQGSYQRIEREPYLDPTYLLNLPLSDKSNGVEYYHHSDNIRQLYGFPVKRRRIPPDWISYARSGDGVYHPHEWSNSELILTPMSESEKQRLLNPHHSNSQMMFNHFDSNIQKAIASLTAETLSRTKVQQIKNKLRKIGFQLNGD